MSPRPAAGARSREDWLRFQPSARPLRVVEGAAGAPAEPVRGRASTRSRRNSSARSSICGTEPAEYQLMPLDPSTADTSHDASAYTRSGNYGLPASAFERAWTIEDIQGYLRIDRTQSYALMRDPQAPPRLRTGRSHRWNGWQVMAFLHGQDWRLDATPAPTSIPAPSFSEGRGAAAGSFRKTESESIVPVARALGHSSDAALERWTSRTDSSATSDQSNLDGEDEPLRLADEPSRTVVRVVDPATVQQHRAAARLSDLLGPGRSAS